MRLQALQPRGRGCDLLAPAAHRLELRCGGAVPGLPPGLPHPRGACPLERRGRHEGASWTGCRARRTRARAHPAQRGTGTLCAAGAPALMEPAAIEQMYQIENHHWWFVGKRLLVAVLLGEVLDTRGLRILDIGCGTGAVLAHLKERARAVGVDHSPLALAYCRKRGLALLACADGERLPFVPASFDVILMLDVLEHAIDDVGLLRAVGALLRPGGMVLVSVPAFQGLWSPHDEVLHHLRRYTARGLRRVMNEAGFVVERLTYTNVAAFPPAVLGLAAAGSVVAVAPGLREGDVPRRLARLAVAAGLSIIVSLGVIARTPLVPGRLAADRMQWIWIAVTYIAVLAPFFLSGLSVTVILSTWSQRIGRLYLADLV